jgi:sugar/nucleoside kinase (ribokinase family)
MQKAVDQVQKTLNAENKLVICPWGELVRHIESVYFENTFQGVIARLNLKSKVVQVPAHIPTKVVDTLAAGDTFIATCIHYLNDRVDLPTVLKKATLLAGIKVGQKSVLNLDVSKLGL